ncbi:hypothetical protein NNA36_12935 [Shimia sp. CNT1-13L.2]|uniref:hypothetical protein n=1 Tax=Shimia sp. CNT1-13L.2 TaxID=2959663 RepID=UPI0020CD2541|nr:hypothetical protein [Shimia sp. CNT1-13L.2]MCP9482868.1 hypothetical protein [Shimia sp. CNT1-13L.2]
MSAGVCESKWQCQVNGLAGTAMVLSVAVLAWVLFEAVEAGAGAAAAASLGLLYAPTFLSVLYGALRRVGRQPAGWLGFGVAVGGAAWGVVMLNTIGSL